MYPDVIDDVGDGSEDLRDSGVSQVVCPGKNYHSLEMLNVNGAHVA
jgi:hypothetical protein